LLQLFKEIRIKKNLKKASNEKLLRAASQKKMEERENMDQKIELIL